MMTNSSCSADVSRYNLPQATGTTLTPELMKRIQEGVPSLMGLKHSASDSQVGLVSAYIGERCRTNNAVSHLAAICDRVRTK